MNGSEIAMLEDKVTELSTKLDHADAKAKEKDEKIEMLDESVNTLSSELNYVHAEADNKDSEIENLEEKVTALSMDLDEANRKQATLEGRMDAMKEHLKELTVTVQTNDKIHQRKPWSPGPPLFGGIGNRNDQPHDSFVCYSSPDNSMGSQQRQAQTSGLANIPPVPNANAGHWGASQQPFGGSGPQDNPRVAQGARYDIWGRPF